MNRTMRARLPWIALIGLGVVACQLVVGEGALSDVRCENEGWEGPPACDMGQVCSAGRCVASSSLIDAGGDGPATGGSGGDGTVPDVGPDGPPDVLFEGGADVSDDKPEVVQPGTFGAACDSDDDCDSNLCLELPNKGARCSTFCCNSTECPTSTAICVPRFGASACVEAAALNRTVGATPVGQMCASGSECRSGRCSNSRCVDTCCGSTSECRCQLVNFEGASSWYCGAGEGTVGNLEACTDASVCASANCTHIVYIPYTWEDDRCGDPCCSDEDCGNGYCEYVRAGSWFVRQCVPTSLGKPPAEHPPCCSDANCGEGRCTVTQEDAWTSPYTSKASVSAFRCL